MFQLETESLKGGRVRSMPYQNGSTDQDCVRINCKKRTTGRCTGLSKNTQCFGADSGEAVFMNHVAHASMLNCEQSFFANSKGYTGDRMTSI